MKLGSEGTSSTDDFMIDNNYLCNNFPNPFSPNTTISFSLKNNSVVELSIYDIKGQKVKSITSERYSKGNHSVIWNGKNEQDKLVSSGIYFYKLNVNGKTESVKKCLILK